MDHFAGLDVSVKETGVCILDDAGKIVPSEPQTLLKVLGNLAYCFKRIGLEAGPFSAIHRSRRSRVTRSVLRRGTCGRC
jgi:transposase